MQTETITLRSINDCPFGLVEDEEFTDLCFMFAAYVNEQHPFADKFLREALDRGAVGFLYRLPIQATPPSCIRQVFALWDALTVRDVRYSEYYDDSRGVGPRLLPARAAARRNDQ